MANEFTQYQRKQVAELRPYIDGESLYDISISQEDIKAGSPKLGDMIARNPKNHADQWLVAKAYFEENFDITRPAAPVEGLETVRPIYSSPSHICLVHDDYVTRSQAEEIIAALQSDVAGSASVIEHLTQRAEKAEADNAALTARVKELEGERDEALKGNRYAQLERIATKRAEALETQLAAARNVLSVFLSEYDALYLFCDEPPSMVSAVEASRAALEDLP